MLDFGIMYVFISSGYEGVVGGQYWVVGGGVHESQYIDPL